MDTNCRTLAIKEASTKNSCTFYLFRPGKSKVLVAVTINRRRFKHEFDSRSTLGQVLEHWVGTGDLVIPASKSVSEVMPSPFLACHCKILDERATKYMVSLTYVQPQLRYLNKIFQDMNKTLHGTPFSN